MGLSDIVWKSQGNGIPGDMVSCVPGPAPWFPSAAAALGNLVEMQILGAHPRSSESETLELGLLNLQFTNPPGASNTAKSENRHVKPSVALC